MPELSAARQAELKELAGRLGLTLHDPSLLDEALTHTSYANEAQGNAKHNERLEFLGDAVLELASSTYLYQHFPELPEGELTRTRASIVRSETLAGLAGHLGLGDYLRLGHGEEQSGGRERQTNLEDAFEAVLGAIYLDQGWEIARDCALRQLAPALKKLAHGKALRDYKTLLQEHVQKTPGHRIEYRQKAATGPDHAKRYTFAVLIDGKELGEGEGPSKKEAEQRAAKLALGRLRG